MGVTLRARLKNYIAANPGATLADAARDLCISNPRRIREAIVDLLNYNHIKPDPEHLSTYGRRDPATGHFYPRHFVVDNPDKDPDSTEE
jgi:hypothetical protein